MGSCPTAAKHIHEVRVGARRRGVTHRFQDSVLSNVTGFLLFQCLCFFHFDNFECNDLGVLCWISFSLEVHVCVSDPVQMSK